MNRPFWSRRRPASSDFETETCDGIEPLLSLYADGMAAPEESRRVAAHLATCADCRESLAWMQATHRALASRPIVAPPANLQARIAEAIAASSASPVHLSPMHLSPVRVFSLRPAYAAAASLTVLGIVFGVSLLHHPAPSPTLAAHHVAPPIVAAIPKSVPITPAQQSPINIAQVTPKPLTTIHPRVRREERVASAVMPPTESSPRPYREHPTALVVKTLPIRAVAKAPLHFSTKPVLLAKNNPVRAESLHSAMPIPAAPRQVAAVPQNPPLVPVNIGSPRVTTQPEPPHIQLASDVLGQVRTQVALMRTAGYTTIVKSVSHTALNLSGIDANKLPTVDITHGDLQR